MIKYLDEGKRISPRAIDKRCTVTELIDNAFLAYNAGRLREACRIFSEKYSDEDVTVGMSQGKRRFFSVPFSSVVKRTRGGQQVAGFEDNFSDIGVVVSIEAKEELIQ